MMAELTKEEEEEENKKKKTPEEEAKETRRRMVERWGNLIKLDDVTWTFYGGQRYDITQLLSSDCRDYLIKSDGQQVKINHLSDKCVVPDFADSLLQKVFEFEFPVPLPAIAAFGSDWNLVAKESNITLKEGCCSDYPFIKSNLGEEEVRRELIRWHNWDLELIFPGLSSLN